MTENKREEILKDMRGGYFDTYDGPTMDELYEQIEKEHKEIQQYRAIGLTPFQIYEKIGGLDVELGKYQSIGTIEELEILKEKSMPKKPIYSDYDDNGDDKIIPYKATCPVCEHEFEFGYWNDEYNHHCICGQVMNWEQD